MGKLKFKFLYAVLGLSLSGIVFLAADFFLGSDFDPLTLWVLAAGLVTFVFYGWDKAQSQRGGERIPNDVLHGLSLAGGFAGGWLGIFFFRHKTQKQLFRLILLTATALWVWLMWL